MKHVSDLFACIKAGDILQVKELIQANHQLAQSKDARGVSAVMFAAYCKHADIVAYLRTHIKELDFFEASILGDLPSLEKQVKRHPTLSQEYSSDGFTALHLAAFFSQAQAVEFLIKHQADVNVISKNPMKIRPLHSAVVRKDTQITATLLRAGAQVDAKQYGGWTALHTAAASGDKELVQLLLNASADPHIENDEGKTPISMAFAKGHSEIVHLLSK